jgi:lipopolysaccharide/colanic/teichoic acid biosynthesis glycosyltransferase
MPLWKKCIDILGAGFGLVASAPLFLIVSIIIKVVSPGPIFFRQVRVGYRGEHFELFKFRTMHVDVDTSEHETYLSKLIRGGNEGSISSDTPMEKIDNKNQIIPFGTILRKSCIDELPQLINVLRGEMSLIGPRPAIPYEVEQYSKWHLDRLNCTPGLTGLWQVSGKNALSFNEMIRLDLHYICNKSILLDLKILLKTPVAILLLLLK